MYDFQDGRLLGDVKTRSGNTALEHSENESGKVDAIPKFTVAGGGFPCKDVSLQLQEVEGYLQQWPEALELVGGEGHRTAIESIGL